MFGSIRVTAGALALVTATASPSQPACGATRGLGRLDMAPAPPVRRQSASVRP